MIKFSLLLVILTLNVNIFAAAAVSLHGTVKDTEGTAVSGVNITLCGIKTLFTSSDANGNFSINSTSVNQLKSTAKFPFQFSLDGNRLAISPVFKNTSGNIAVFTGDGRQNTSITFSGSKNGKQTVTLPGLASGVSIVRITIGNKTFSRALVRLDNSTTFLKNYLSNRTISDCFVLAKQSAASADTLLARKAGYIEKKIPIDSYEKSDIAIVMSKETIAGEMPLVYDKENTGEDCPTPALADDPTKLPPITYLPDPFLLADGNRMTTRTQWQYRRAEIKAMIEKYGTGIKQGKPDKFEPSLSGSTITMKCTVGSNSITLTATISRPVGAPDTPIPAIIGINGAAGSLPANIFSSRGIATITFSSDQIMANGFSATARNSGNFAKLYPNDKSGSMVRWAWGISRIIDALEALPEAKIDLKHIAVSGCSYQGKIALYAGVFDERIALTIPHESGGGGTISWRYSDILDNSGEVEGLHHAQGAPWYAEILMKYQPDGVSPNTLPYDQHELIAMIAPRAVLCIESSKIYRMGAEAARVDALAAREVWKALGVPFRMGATEENIDHCVWAAGFTADLEAYVDKFLLDKSTVDTDILRSKFTSVDRTKWIPWTTPELD